MMENRNPPQRLAWAAAGLAAVLWLVTFALPWGNFWIKISCSASLLALLATGVQGGARQFSPPTRQDLIRGLASAAALWLIFWAGKAVSAWIFPFAGAQVGAIYHKGAGVPPAVIFFLLLLVTGPAEEIFWRGFLQKALMARMGKTRGWAVATAVYAGVHICSTNFMLVGAAAVAGAFWGLCYWRWGRLWPVIISHSIWSAVIFAVLPIP